MTMRSINPVTGQLVKEYEELTPEAAAGIVEDVHATFLDWRRTSFAERAALMRSAADVLRARTSELSRLMAVEMGKPVSAGKAEVNKCALACEFYADNAEGFLAPEKVDTEARKSFVASTSSDQLCCRDRGKSKSSLLGPRSGRWT